MCKEGLLCILQLTVRPDQNLYEAQEHKVVHLALFLGLLSLFLLFPDFLFFGFDLGLDFGSLLGCKLLLLVTLLLALGRGQVVRRGLSASPGRRVEFVCISLTWALSKLISLLFSSLLVRIAIVQLFLLLLLVGILAFVVVGVT